MWEFNNTSWDQDDEAQSYRLKSLHGKECTAEPVAPLGMLVGAKAHKINSDLACASGAFPMQFTHCPYCGGELIAPENRPSMPWIPPYGNGTGLKILANEVNLASMLQEKGESLTIPSMNGRYSFCSARLGAEQRLLVALQRDTGKISVYQPGVVGRWRDLDGKAGEDRLPEWSWALATDTAETGLAIPGGEGPAWITIDWAAGKLQIDRGVGRSVGGAVRLGKFLFAPVMRGNQFFMLCRKDGDVAWSDCMTSCDVAVVEPQLQRNDDKPAFMGIPVIDESKMIAYWPCRGGYVKVKEASSAREHAWEFRPWETDEHPATALIELGPPYRKTGARSGFWQLCVDHDPESRDGLVNKIIKLDGDENADSDVLEYGQFVSTGRASFGWLHDYWSEVDVFNSNRGEQSELRYPLMQFGDKGLALIAKVRPWSGREDVGLLSDVFFNPEERSSVFVRFVIEGVGTPEKVLYVQGIEDGLFKLSLAQVPEISVFIYDAFFHIYLPEENKCYRWPLELTGL